jgi:hypothetical protein
LQPKFDVLEGQPHGKGLAALEAVDEIGAPAAYHRVHYAVAVAEQSAPVAYSPLRLSLRHLSMFCRAGAKFSVLIEAYG